MPDDAQRLVVDRVRPPGRPRWRTVAPAIVVAILGSVLTLALVVGQRGLTQQTPEQTADAIVEATAVDARNRLQALAEATVSLSELYASSDFSAHDFRSIATVLLQQHPELQALRYATVVSRSERPAFERRLRRLGLASGINDPTPRGLVRAGERPVYVAVRHAQPRRGNEAVFGLDITARRVDRQAVQHARDIGTAQVGGRTWVEQGGTALRAITIFAPVYQPGSRPATIEERRRVLWGITGAVVGYDRVMSSLGEGVPDSADLVLLDPGTTEGPPIAVWRSPGASTATIADLATWPAQRELALPGRTLLLVGRPSFGAPEPWRPLVMAFLGLLVTVVVTLTILRRFEARRVD